MDQPVQFEISVVNVRRSDQLVVNLDPPKYPGIVGQYFGRTCEMDEERLTLVTDRTPGPQIVVLPPLWFVYALTGPYGKLVFTLPWRNLRHVQVTRSELGFRVNAFGVRQEDQALWTCCFACETIVPLLLQMTRHVQVDGAAELIRSNPGQYRVKLPSRDAAKIDGAQLQKYLLSPIHPVGRLKAKYFRELGYTQENWQALQAGLREQHLGQDTNFVAWSAHRQKYEIRAPLHRPGNQPGDVTSVWIVSEGDSSPRFVTAYSGELQ